MQQKEVNMMKCDNCGKTGNFGHKFHRRIYPNLFFSHYKVKETIQFVISAIEN